MSELQVNTIRPVSGTTLTVTNDTNLTVSGSGKVTTPLVEAADLDINGTSSLELKFNNTTKLAVTNTGATVTGTMAATAFSGDGSGLTGITSAGTGGTSSTGNLQLISNSGGANGARDIVFLDQNSEKARLYGATGDFAVDTDTLYVKASNDRVGIGTTSPTSTLDVDGTCTATAFVGPITGNVTGNVTGDVTGTILTASQPNITSTGALTIPSATVSGNVAVNGGDITTTSTGTVTVFNTNATVLNAGGAASTVNIGSTSTGTVQVRNLSMNAGYGSIAPVYGCRAWANASTYVVSGTYSRTGTLVTVTLANHGLETGFRAELDFTSGTSGTATDGFYTVTKVNANSYTVVDTASGSTSGNVTQKCFIRASANIASASCNTSNGKLTLTFANAMPDIYYSTMVSTDQASAGFIIATGASGGGLPGGGLTSQTTSSVDLQAFNLSGTPSSSNNICVAVFR